MPSFITYRNEVNHNFNNIHPSNFVDITDVTDPENMLTRSPTNPWIFRPDTGSTKLPRFQIVSNPENTKSAQVVALINTTLPVGAIDYLRIRPDGGFPVNYSKSYEIFRGFSEPAPYNTGTNRYPIRDIYFYFDEPVADCARLEVRLKPNLGIRQYQIGTVFISSVINIRELLDGTEFSANDISIKVRSEGGQITSTKKQVLRTANIPVIVDNLTAWGYPTSGIIGISDLWDATGTSEPVIFLKYSDDGKQQFGIYGTLDKINPITPAKSLDTTSDTTGAIQQMWKTRFNITQEL